MSQTRASELQQKRLIAECWPNQENKRPRWFHRGQLSTGNPQSFALIVDETVADKRVFSKAMPYSPIAACFSVYNKKPLSNFPDKSGQQKGAVLVATIEAGLLLVNTSSPSVAVRSCLNGS